MFNVVSAKKDCFVTLLGALAFLRNAHWKRLIRLSVRLYACRNVRTADGIFLKFVCAFLCASRIQVIKRVISGFRRDVGVSGQPIGLIFKGQSKKTSWTSWLLKKGPVGSFETSVQNYHSTLHNIPEECRSQVIKHFWEQKCFEARLWGGIKHTSGRAMTQASYRGGSGSIPSQTTLWFVVDSGAGFAVSTSVFPVIWFHKCSIRLCHSSTPYAI
jgi:hypothetical protein